MENTRIRDLIYRAHIQGQSFAKNSDANWKEAKRFANEILEELEREQANQQMPTEQLQQADVSGSILMNILEENYELNKQFHEIAREMIFSFAVAHYDEKLTFKEWIDKYYS